MAINKKLIHFKNKEAFDRELQAGNIMDTSICWIPDAKFIYTRGTYWYCSSKSDAEIQQLISDFIIIIHLFLKKKFLLKIMLLFNQNMKMFYFGKKFVWSF